VGEKEEGEGRGLFPVRSGEICGGRRGRRRKRKEKENGPCFI